MRGVTAARVLASRSKLASPGDIVSTMSGWTEYAILDEGKGQFEPAAQFPSLSDAAPQDILSVLGMTGLTAWVGMTQIGDPKPGELVVVSGAAGATGSVAGQIAKIKGAKVIGICGGEDKCKWLVDDLGFDVALNYKADDFKEKFKEATKAHIDVYFDNGKSHRIAEEECILTAVVGGEILDMCLSRAKEHARFVMCGGISQYNTSTPQGPRNISKVITMRIRMQGFIVLDHVSRAAEARKEMAAWIKEGKLKKTETIIRGGLEQAEQALVDLFKGKNLGKLLVEVKAGGAKL